MERKLQVGDRCYIYNSVDLVIIDAINPVGVPNTYAVTYLTGERRGTYILVFGTDLQFSYPEQDARSV